MEKREVKCTCKFIFAKVILIAGIAAGVLLAVLGIVTITGNTGNLFASKFVRWYKTDYHTIKFSNTKGLSSTRTWARQHEFFIFEWEWNTDPVCVVEADGNYLPLRDSGFRTENLVTGKAEVSLKDWTIVTHYYCVSRDNGVSCHPESQYRGKIEMYVGTPFYTNGILGNQNFRFTFFIIACLTVTFGIIMILGELHVPLITTKFTFFYYSFVKGIIYIAVGFLVMGMSNLFGLFVAIFMWIVGILNCIYGWRSLTTFQWNKVGARGTTTIVTRREYI